MPGPGALLALVRWPGVVTAAGNAATCFLLAHRPGSPGGRAAAAGAVLGAVCVYAGGVVLNDVADAEKDRALHPGRPIPSGRVARGAAAGFGVALLAAGVLAAALLGGPDAGLCAAAAAALAAAYDFAPSGARLVGALLLGGARAANAAAGAAAATGGLGLLADGHALPWAATAHPFALLAYTALLTWISTFEERRVRTAGVVFLATSLAVAAALPWAAFPRTTWPEAPAIAFVLLAGTLAAAAREALDAEGPGIGALVRAGVFGFLLVDAAWLFGAGRYEPGFYLVLVYVVLRLLLARARS